MELGEDGRGPEEERHDSDGSRESAGLLLLRLLEDRLDHLRMLFAHQSAELMNDPSAHGIRSEDCAGYRHDDEEDRRQREHGVVGERGALGHRVVREPVLERRDDDVAPGGQPWLHGQAAAANAVPGSRVRAEFRHGTNSAIQR
jgi:hypothetical protein